MLLFIKKNMEVPPQLWGNAIGPFRPSKLPAKEYVHYKSLQGVHTEVDEQ